RDRNVTGVQTCALPIWFVIVKIGVFHVNVHGEFQFQYFTEKMENRLLQTKRLQMYRNYLLNMVQIFGLNGMQKIYYLKDSHLNIVRMACLRKNQTLWTFGLIQVHLMKQYYYIV